MNFNKWLDTFLSEKEIDLDEDFVIKGSCYENIFTYGAVVEQMKYNASAEEQAKMKAMLVKIDFQNGDVKRYIRHLAQALAI